MGSKDRILRQKEETRNNILTAASEIVREEGWNGLSMRKIADRIEYTAPIIYEYFSNKDAILMELTRKGFLNLTNVLQKAKNTSTDPAEQLEAMWKAYWDFAFQDKESYQVMFGVQMICCNQNCMEAQKVYELFSDSIRHLMEKQQPSEETVKQKYFTFFSVIHGLISLNFTGAPLPAFTNGEIFKDAVGGIITSIRD